MQRKRFVIAGMQRSGTTVTHVCLAGHPNVSMTTDEVYVEPFFTRGLATFTGGKESYRERKVGYERLFELLTSFHADADTRAIGFKTAIRTHSEAIDLANTLREYLPDVAVIIVHRDDLVAQCGSLARAEKSGEWHAWEGAKSSHQGKLSIDPRRFEDYARDCLGTLSQLRTLAETHRVLEFNYEADIVPGDAWNRLFEFLDLPIVPIRWLRMKKVAPPPQDFIENYDNLLRRLEKLTAPSSADEHAKAEAAAAAQAERETPNFLLHRAIDRLQRGRTGPAQADVRAAMAKGGSIDYSLQGQVFALLEKADADSPALPTIERASGDNAFFLLHRARLRLDHDRAEPARADLAAVLGSEAVDEQTVKHSFALLERALTALDDGEVTQRTLAGLLDSYGDNQHFLFLQGLAALHAGRADEGKTSLARVLEIEPGHSRARALLQERAND